MDRIRFLTVQDIVALHDAAMALSDQPPAALVREDALEIATHQAKNGIWEHRVLNFRYTFPHTSPWNIHGSTETSQPL